MSMRAQVSLKFNDKELYESFILPSKSSRLLNGIIVKCLSAYYYDENIRNMIEGVSAEDYRDEDEAQDRNQKNQKLFDDIKTTLMMQDFITSELKNTFEMGIEDATAVLNRANTVMEKSGVVKSKQSEYGGSNLQIEDRYTETAQNTPEATQPVAGQSNNISNALLMKLLGILVKDANSVEGAKVLGEMGGEPVQVEEKKSEIKEEISRSTVNNEESSSLFEDSYDFNEEEESSVNSGEDASESMAELIASLGI